VRLLSVRWYVAHFMVLHSRRVMAVLPDVSGAPRRPAPGRETSF
jgi:hypothetical protein